MNKGIRSLEVCHEVLDELREAMLAYGPMASAHEGHGVIEEERFELWLEVIKKRPDVSRMRTEAIQLAAMAIRFVVDVCDKGLYEENSGEPTQNS